MNESTVERRAAGSRQNAMYDAKSPERVVNPLISKACDRWFDEFCSCKTLDLISEGRPTASFWQISQIRDLRTCANLWKGHFNKSRTGESLKNAKVYHFSPFISASKTQNVKS
jgi:hypothetical protein